MLFFFIFFLFGLVFLIKGKVQISRNRSIQGSSARVLGLIYVVSFIVALAPTPIPPIILFGLPVLVTLGLIFFAKPSHEGVVESQTELNAKPRNKFLLFLSNFSVLFVIVGMLFGGAALMVIFTGSAEYPSRVLAGVILGPLALIFGIWLASYGAKK